MAEEGYKMEEGDGGKQGYLSLVQDKYLEYVDKLEIVCLRSNTFNNMEDLHMSCTFSESLDCPFT